MRRHNPPTLQVMQRIDSGLPYHTLNTQRLRNASPLQTGAVERRPAWLMRTTLTIGVLILCLLAAGLLLPR